MKEIHFFIENSDLCFAYHKKKTKGNIIQNILKVL